MHTKISRGHNWNYPGNNVSIRLGLTEIKKQIELLKIRSIIDSMDKLQRQN